MVTEFGKYLRKLRVDRNEVLKDMALKLKVSPSFLSAVEIGKKKIPAGFIERIATLYNLPEEERGALEDIEKDSVPSVKINLLGSGSTQRKVALTFARCFGTLSDGTAQQIINILQQAHTQA